MVSMAFLKAGLDPDADRLFCGGGLRVGNRFFRCWKRGGHGTVNMAKGIYQSCDVPTSIYFAQKIGMDPIAAMAHRCGMGQDLRHCRSLTQFYGTVPDPAWKLEEIRPGVGRTFDTVNATIGQGYMLANPLQLAVMSGAASPPAGTSMPKLLLNAPRAGHPSPPRRFRALSTSPMVREAMKRRGERPRHCRVARSLPVSTIVLMAGKTGTAQVVSSQPFQRQVRARGSTGTTACSSSSRPFDNPRYAGAVVIEHGGGSGAAYPIARDVMTFLFDPAKALDALRGFEEGWGGTAQQRLATKYAAYAAAAGIEAAPLPRSEADLFARVDAEARVQANRTEQQGGRTFEPRPEANPVSTGTIPGAAPTVPAAGAGGNAM